MTILAFLQNMWFKNPEKAREIFDRRPEFRNRLIREYLFMGCLTGRRLKAAFGEELCDQIIWEEISRQIGGESSSKFPPEPDHIRDAIIKHKPGIVLAFGALAARGVFPVVTDLCAEGGIRQLIFLSGPHPAARGADVPQDLAELAGRVNQLCLKAS